MNGVERDEVARVLAELGDDPNARAARQRACEALAAGLADLGRTLWVGGYMIGPHRAEGVSPFADDRIVGVATVAQMGGELARGSVGLLIGGNLYAASALLRQLVEVEYLATAFAAEHEDAALWLRADRKERLAFWSPARLRERLSGTFMASDYWHHCELGGHPTTRGMTLLPDHVTLNSAFLWVDLANHLRGIWRNVIVSAERFHSGPVPDGWNIADVNDAVDAWQEVDGLHAAVADLTSILRATPIDD